jgi:hypothetical protein
MIHTTTMTSLIILDHLRQETREKRTSTFSSRRIVFYSPICGGILKNYRPTPMTKLFDGTYMHFSWI